MKYTGVGISFLVSNIAIGMFTAKLVLDRAWELLWLSVLMVVLVAIWTKFTVDKIDRGEL